LISLGADVVVGKQLRNPGAPCVAQGADATALAGEGHKVVVPAIVTGGTGKAVREDAAVPNQGQAGQVKRTSTKLALFPVLQEAMGKTSLGG